MLQPDFLARAPTVRDQVAWRELRGALSRFVSRRVSAPDDEDVLHEVFLRVSRGLPELRDGERLTAWVYQVARHAIVDHYRRPRSQREDAGERDPDQLPDVVEADDALAAGELAGVVRDFVGLLPAPYREALELTDLDGLTQAEAAARLGLSVPGMKSRVQRARAQVRDLLDACCEIEVDVRGRVVECEPRRRPAALPDCCSRSMVSRPR